MDAWYCHNCKSLVQVEYVSQEPDEDGPWEIPFCVCCGEEVEMINE